MVHDRAVVQQYIFLHIHTVKVGRRSTWHQRMKNIASLWQISCPPLVYLQAAYYYHMGHMLYMYHFIGGYISQYNEKLVS